MHIVVLVALATLIVVLLVSLIYLRRRDYSALSNRMAARTRDALHVMKPCPICGTLLSRGERVHTVVYRQGGEGRRDGPTESLVHMFGCPYCYPATPRYPRVCPVCDGTLPDDGYLVARMFEKGARKHVHVLGCTVCREGSKKREAGH